MLPRTDREWAGNATRPRTSPRSPCSLLEPVRQKQTNTYTTVLDTTILYTTIKCIRSWSGWVYLGTDIGHCEGGVSHIWVANKICSWSHVTTVIWDIRIILRIGLYVMYKTIIKINNNGKLNKIYSLERYHPQCWFQQKTVFFSSSC